jgi:ribonuclease MRP protein subunit RMP1
MEKTPITKIHELTPLKLPSSSQTTDLQHLHALMHLLHHRNHNQHRRSTWYRHFNNFRRHLGSVLEYLTSLNHVPTTNLARHRKKAEDEALRLRIQQTLSFWRDVLVPKTQHAFGQLLADGRFAVLGVVLTAILGHVCRVFGLISVYEELGEEETRKAIEQFAAEGWGEDEGLGVLIPREAEKREDFGEILTREDTENESDTVVAKARATEKELRKSESGCLAPERDMLEQSRKAMKAMAASGTPVTSSRKSSTLQTTKTKASKGTKVTEPNRKPKLAKILPAVNWDDNSTAPLPKTSSDSTAKYPEPITLPSTTSSKLKKKRPKQEEDDILTSVAKPIKKKKKKNAIDDLFAGL